jgi:hypothetical protein
MAYNISPLSFAEILDRAFGVFRDHFILLVSISAIGWIPYGVVLAIAGSSRPAIVMSAQLGFALIFPIISLAITAAVIHVYLDRPVTIGDAYRSISSLITPVIGTYLLFYLLLILAFLALLVPGIYFAICWSLMAPVIIVEHRFGIVALRRSRQLVTGVWWRTFGIFLLAGLIAGTPAGILNLFWAYIPFLGQILTTATSAIASSYSLVVLVIYYFDRRCRLEDFDLRFLAEQIRSEAPMIAEPAARLGSHA